MQSAAQYRTYADECRKLAQKLKPEHRDALTRIAAAWDKCADEVEAAGKDATAPVAIVSDRNQAAG